MFAFLVECVVSEDPISPQPQAWLQGLEYTASTDEFVSVIKAHTVFYSGTRQTHTCACTLVLSFNLDWALFVCRYISIHRPH